MTSEVFEVPVESLAENADSALDCVKASVLLVESGVDAADCFGEVD